MDKTRVVVCTVAAAVSSSAGAATVTRGFDLHPTGNGVLASFPDSESAEAQHLLTAGGASGFLGFETFADGSVPANWDLGNGIGAAYTNEATTVTQVLSSVSSVTTYPAEGVKHLYSETQPGAGFFRLAFNQPLTGIGFFFTDASDWINNSDTPGPLYIELLDSVGGVIGTFDLTSGFSPSIITNGSMGFFGIVADAPFNGIRIAQPLRDSGANSLTDAVGFDRISVTVPGPVASAFAPLIALGAVRRRRSG